MKKLGLVICCVLFFSSFYSNAQIKTVLKKGEMEKVSLYDFKVKDIDGKDFSFRELKGKKILIVNTASECGFTPQYKELEELYQKYKKEGFVVVGFPANNFGNQEPGTDKQIAQFCAKNFGVTFPMMSKISVEGKDMSEVYKFLTQKSKNGLEDSVVDWNFQKYLINEKGQLIAVFPSKISPMSEDIITAILTK